MSEPDDGRTLRDVGRGDSGASDAAAPDTVRESSVGVPCVGEVVGDRYRVERVIGAGGMGQVLAVRHVKLEQLFAMKVLDPELSDDDDARARFAREARAMAALTSPHTVRVHDVAELPNKLPYLVMDYLDGQDLSAILRRRGALPIEEAVSYIMQACEALEEAHAAGLVHRDLKPQNLFVAKDANGKETVRVLDFGIARALGGKVGKLKTITRHGDVLGTLSYMAPEQIRSARAVDPRSDIWAIGACLYRLLTSSRPFVAAGEGSLVEAILTKEPHPIRELRPEVPPALALVVQRCMKKDPAARFASVRELRAALALALATKDIPLDDGTVPMPNAPVRPPMQSEPPPATVPLPSPLAALPPAARASTAILPGRGPTIAHGVGHVPVAGPPSRPTPEARARRDEGKPVSLTPILVICVVGGVAAVLLIVLALRMMAR